MRIEKTTFPLSDKLINDFEVYQSDIKRNDTEKIFTRRKEAFDQFLQLGLPTQKLEDWKNTDLTEVYQEEYNHYYQNPEKIEDIDKVFQCNVPHLDTINACHAQWQIYYKRSFFAKTCKWCNLR